MKKHTIEECHEFATSIGYICISTEYTFKSMNWICDKGHHLTTPFRNMYRYGTRCGTCYYIEMAQKTFEQCKQIASHHNAILLSTSYKTNYIPLTWKCSNGHIFKRSFKKVLSSHNIGNTICNVCLKGHKGIGYCEHYIFTPFIEKIIPNHLTLHKQFPVKSPKKGRYKLDFYIPEINLAIEFDEERHHYNGTNILSDDDILRETHIKNVINCEFLRIRQRDFLMCKENTRKTIQRTISGC